MMHSSSNTTGILKVVMDVSFLEVFSTMTNSVILVSTVYL